MCPARTGSSASSNWAMVGAPATISTTTPCRPLNAQDDVRGSTKVTQLSTAPSGRTRARPNCQMLPRSWFAVSTSRAKNRNGPRGSGANVSFGAGANPRPRKRSRCRSSAARCTGGSLRSSRSQMSGSEQVRSRPLSVNCPRADHVTFHPMNAGGSRCASGAFSQVHRITLHRGQSRKATENRA